MKRAILESMTPHTPPPPEKDPASADRPPRKLRAWQVAAAAAIVASSFTHYGFPAGAAAIAFVAAGMGFTYARDRVRMFAAAALMAAAGAALAAIVAGAA